MRAAAFLPGMFALFFSLTFVLPSCTQGLSNTASGSVTASDFAKKIDEMPDAAMVDVRTPGEFAAGHIQGAVNANIGGPEFAALIATLDKSKPVLVYCLSGSRSLSAVRRLTAAGFPEVYELSGGLMKWRAANLPLVTGADGPAPGMSVADMQAELNTDKYVLIDFYATWCLPCRKMEPYFAEIAAERPDAVKVLRVDVDKNPLIAQKFGVQALPTIMLVKDQKILWTKEGYYEKSALLEGVQ